MTSSERQPNPQALLESAVETIERVLVPELQSTWAHSTALGLVGQLRYALARIERDLLGEQTLELERCLATLTSDFPTLGAVADEVSPTGDARWDLRQQAGRLLVYAVESEAEPAARAIREHLRPLLRKHAAEDLAESGPMLQAFLASGSLGSSR